MFKTNISDMKIKTFEAHTNSDKLYGYHVTSKANLPSIMKTGLETRVPEDYGTDGDVKAVYLFKTIDDAKTALSTWLGDRMDDWEEENGEKYEEVTLKVDLTGMEYSLVDSVEFEWMCIDDIPKERIIEVLDI